MDSTSNWIWIQDKEYDWLPARILESFGEKLKVKVKLGHSIEEERYLEKSKHYDQVDTDCLQGIGDLLNLGDFNQQTLLHNTRERYSKDEIYTFIGPPILIAVNPYQHLKIYGEDYIGKYKSFFNKMKQDVLNLI